ncbi:cysteine desulfurase [Parashewanella curva]|uniref:Cysteine desulfurase n=1 Tax=Parashewanella curva TaxID=2338552 RepID=A0A3L8PX80_9GAMM|nr:cysteine desulfurase [Parashewanella curva]RLV59233.1 cysteine desulfurase [Parashewanella curva]
MTQSCATPLAIAIRPLFPTLESTEKVQPLCYLDTAATSQKPLSVIERMQDYYLNENSNVHRGAYQLSAQATQKYEQVREQVKNFIYAQQSQQIIFTHGTTEAINMVAWGIEPQITQGDIILVDTASHHANIVPWQQLAKRTGAEVKAIGLTTDSRFDLESYRQLLTLNPKVVAVPHITNALGTVNPVETIVELAKQVNAITLIDGAQAVAHMPLNVSELDCDFYVFSGHKMYGPTGVGILYGKTSQLEALQPLMTGGEMIKTVSFEETTFGALPNRLEAGTPPIAEVIGLGKAIEFIQNNLTAEHQAEEQALLQYLQAQLKQLNGIELYGAHESNIAVVAFNLLGEHHQDIGILLDQQNIAIRCGHHCAMPLMQHLNLKGCCRVSLGIYSTKADIDQFITALKAVQELFAE